MRTRKKHQRLKEGETITLTAFPPTAAGFSAWRENTYAEVLKCSGRSTDEPVIWLMEVEDDSASHASLADPGKFTTLDLKLMAAINKVAKDKLGREITEAADEERKVHRRQLRGRQALLIIYKWYSVNDRLKQVYKLTDLMKVKCNGDHELADFILGWKKIYRGIT